jgi:hypothetical protein
MSLKTVGLVDAVQWVSIHKRHALTSFLARPYWVIVSSLARVSQAQKEKREENTEPKIRESFRLTTTHTSQIIATKQHLYMC